jgi:hypothetical protein
MLTNKVLDYHNLNPKYRKPKYPTNKVKRVVYPSWWKMLKAKLFGKRIRRKQNGGYTLCGWKYNGIEYINKIIT